MSAQQPEALRLADVLDLLWAGGIAPEAAAELRRLHALNVELLKVLRMARANIAAELQVMEICHHNPATGLIDDAEVVLLVESEQDLINQIDAAIAQAGVEA